MGNGKIDKVILFKMFRSGKSGAECAKHFGVTPGAISQAKKELDINITKNVGLETAHEVVSEHLNTVQQLRMINSHANEILDLLMRWGRGDKEALQILESQVKKVRVRGTEEDITEYRVKDPRELALKAMAEIRGQLALQLEVFKTMYDISSIADFQRSVLEIIGEVAPDVRERIIRRLKESRALRQSVEIH